MTNEFENDVMFESENTKTIFECWNEALRRFCDVKGRTTRYEFWAFQTVSLLIFIVAALIGFLFGSYKVIFEIYALYFLVPATTVSVRRLHDIGLSGWWVAPVSCLAVIMLICWELQTNFTILPLFLLLCATSYLYFMLSFDGETTDNAYGARVVEPKIYNQDSKVFVMFMAAFLGVLWIIFLIKILF